MGATIDALEEAGSTTLNNPLYIGVAFAIAFTAGIISGVLSLIPIIGSFIGQLIFTTLMAGVMGMVAYSVAKGTSPSPGYYTDVLSNHGVTVLGATFIKQVLYAIIGIFAVLVLIFVAGLGSVAMRPAGASGTDQVGSAVAATGIVTLGLIAIFGLLIAIMGFIFQFITTAIVVDDESAISAFPAAVSLVKNNLISTLGYTISRVFVVGVPYVILYALVAGVGTVSETAGLIAGIIGGLILIPIVGAFMYAYHAHYYMEVTGRKPTV